MSRLNEFISSRVQEVTAPVETEKYTGRVTARLRAEQNHKLDWLCEKLKSTRSGMGERLLSNAIDDAFLQTVELLGVDAGEILPRVNP